MFFGKSKAQKEAEKVAKAIKAEKAKQDELSRPLEYSGYWLNPISIADEYSKCIIAGNFRSFVPNLNILALKDQFSLITTKIYNDEPKRLVTRDDIPVKLPFITVDVNGLTVVMANNLVCWIVVGEMKLEGINDSDIKNRVIYNSAMVNAVELVLKRDLQ